MSIVVTGGAGFIGANLCRTLLNESDLGPVRVLDDLSTGHAENLDALDVEFVHGSILDEDMVRTVCDGAAAVVHLAARPSVPRSIADPLRSHEVNATGTVRVLEAARRAGVTHVVTASSSSVYGSSAALPKSEDLATVPLSPYAASKLASEAYALAYATSYDLDVLALRFFNVFGPLQPADSAYAAVVPAFIDRAMRGEPLLVHGDGSQTRDFTYVDSVAAVIVDALRRGVASPGPVNLAFGGRTDLRSLIEMLEKILGRDLAVDHGPARVGDVAHSQADSTRLRALFPGVDPTDFVTGLERTVEWFREQST